MATLYFKVSSDYDEVIRLRQECEKLEAQLKKMDVNKSPAAAKALETQLASTRQQMMGLVTEAAKAGAVMENDLKKKLYSTSKASEELTEEIIKQKKIIRDTQDDVRRLSDEYSKMGKYSPNSKAKLAELNTAKAALNEQKYSLGELQDQQARNRLEVRKLTREYKEFASGTNNADEIVKSLTDSLKRTAAEIGGLMAIKQFGSDVIDATGRMQQLHVALSTILQDKSKADQLIGEIVQFAAKTPFNLEDVANGAKQLLAYGSTADKVVGELSMLGDVASGLQIPIGQLIYLYGTLRTQGRAMTVDIRQFAGRGIPIYEELAKVLGVSKDQVGELVKEGKVGFKEVEQAFKNMTSEGGKFANLMENSAGTWPQRLSNIEDTLFQKMNEFGNKYKEVFEFGIGTAEDLVESLDDVLSVIGGLIAAYGTYKAALITTAVAQKAVGFVESIRLLGMYRKELGLATAAQQAFNVASKSNVYVALLAALVGIGTAVYMFTKRTNEATAAQETLNSVNKKVDEEFSKQAATVDRLNGILKSETSSLDQKKKALSDLQSIIPSYNASLDEEGKLINNNTEAIQTYLTQLEKQIKLKAAQEELEELYRKKRVQEKDYKSSKENFEKVKKENPLGEFYGESGARLQLYTAQERSSAERKVNKAKEALDETVSAINALEKEIEKSSLYEKKEVSKSTISKEIEDTINRINILKKEITGLRSGDIQAEVGKTVESTIPAKQKELQNAKKTLETLTGKSGKENGNGTVKEQEKLYDQLLQLRFKNQQDEINLMKEGADKKRKQIELDYQKEYAEIQKLEKEWGAKNGGKLSQEQSIEISRRYTNAENKYNSSITSLEGGFSPKELEKSMNEYLSAYGNYIEKRNAIIALGEEKKHGKNKWEQKSIDEETKRAISDLDIEAAKTTSSISRLFGDMRDKTLKELQEIGEKGKAALEFLKSGEWDEEKGLEFGITKEQFETISQSPEKLKDISDALRDNKKAADDLRPAYDKVADGLKKVFNSGNDTKKLKEGLSDIQDGMNDIMQIGSFLSDTFSSLGDAFGNDTLSGIADGINVAMDAMNSAMQGAQAGSMFGPIGAAAGAAIGLVTSLAISIAKIHDAKNEKRIQTLQDQIDVLDKSYEKLGDSIEKAYSKDASNLIDQQNKLLEQQKVLIQQQIREEQDKKKTDDERIKEWQQQIEDINELIEDNKEAAVDAIFGEDLKSAIDDFASAYAEAWANGENRAESAKETVKNMMRQMVTESIKAAMQSSGAMEKIRQKLQEFYADNVLSSWEQDYIYDMAEELQKELDKQFGWADSLMKDEEGKEQQSASSKGFETMSQDSADELNGRFTAVYESNLRIETAEQQQTVAITELRGSISALTIQASGMYNIADETRTILANSYLELQQIRENTGEIVKPIKQIQADIAEVKQNTSRL